MAKQPDPMEIHRELSRCVPALLACQAALPLHDELQLEHDFIEAANQRGYFLPDEEELVLMRYSQYMAIRSALIEVLEDMRRHIGRTSMAWKKWPQRLPMFLAAFAAGCLRHRCANHLITLAADRPVLRKKLDEENRIYGLPRKTFTQIFDEYSRPRNMTRLLVAIDFYRRHHESIRALAEDPLMGPVVELLRREEPWMELSKREALKRRAKYRWFSFLRRNHSAWKSVTSGLFEASGRTLSELRMPGVKARGAPKRITPELRQQLAGLLQPGDVVVTRHDDALTNLFLPGYWPHAALFIGEHFDPASLDETQRSGAIEGQPCFLESLKDGVRVRPFTATLGVDELVVLRPGLGQEERLQGIRKALQHAGKGYDFLFDFSTSERLVCTEVIYRAYHGIGRVRYELREVGGRLCLPAEEFLDQSIQSGFSLIATAGLHGEGVKEGEAAIRAFERVSRPRTEAPAAALISPTQTAC